MWKSGLLSTLAYAAMILAAMAIFLAVRQYGETLVAPVPSPSAAVSPEQPAAPKANALAHILLALAAVVVVGRVLGRVFARIGQPPVIGEVLGGILLGPSLLGRVAPDVAAYVLPVTVAPYLSVVAQLGVIFFYMFLVGLDLNLDPLRSRARATVATSHASILAPFVLGSLLALYLYPRVSTNDVPFTSFALFMGVAMSITAFPVLARILSDRGMTRSELGVIALACAAAGDVTAWCLLAFVVGVVQAEVGSALLVAVYTLGFIALMFLAVKPLVAKLVQRRGGGSAGKGTVALVLVLMLLSALTTEQIGVHAVFGAFLFGAIVPRETGLPRVLTSRLEDLVTILLLPAFFAFTGMRTEISLVSTAAEWAMVLLIIAVATIGKFGGTLAAARVTGMDWQSSASLGVLMNTRGLMELIVLNIGLDLGVISPALFTMLVIMALVTTIATTPLLELLGGGILTMPASQTPERERRR
jgi:Kef-type K+ transport system membrane component KefB